MSSTATPSPNAASLLAPIAEDMQQVNRVIRHRLASEVMLINQISEYIISAGGKRLRPALLLLVAGALGETTGARHELAAVVEFIHTATLLHDDVVDESDLRRGRQTANALFGNAASVLVGDFLYSRSFQMMVGVGKMRVMEILSEATNIISEGEVLQLLNMHDADVDEARYMQVIRYKTAKLFEAAAQLGAVLAGADATIEAAAAEFIVGHEVRNADDLFDVAAKRVRDRTVLIVGIPVEPHVVLVGLHRDLAWHTSVKRGGACTRPRRLTLGASRLLAREAPLERSKSRGVS